ncbi:peptidoglycan-binding protein [Leucobacter iarius]|uniref:Peptidoglycan binding-like domain-containing protein n=1 Tax=Leucobacter iarius TaxID=333963 RepID=A0ABN2LRC6_9MICO
MTDQTVGLTPSTAAGRHEPSEQPGTPKRKRWVLTAAIAATAVVAIAGGAVAWQTLTPTPSAQAEVQKPHTVPATNSPLTWSIRTTGAVTYANTRDLTATLGGTLTQLPKPGTVVGSGGVLYWADDKPVIAVDGKLPAWREFKQGMDDGPDVEQLERYLTDLGYFEGWVDERFSDLTEKAIKQWQEANGLKQDGVIPLGRIVFTQDGIRVGAAKATVGATIAPGAAVYTASGSAPIVTAKISVSDRASVPVGTVATFSLPSGESVTGKVTVARDPTEEEDASGKKTVVIPITITPDDPKKLDGQMALSVQVSFSHQAKGDVLQVPVAALLAAANDTFTVEVYRGKKIVTVPVETGRFAGGMVEITGGKLNAGDLVVVPE